MKYAVWELSWKCINLLFEKTHFLQFNLELLFVNRKGVFIFNRKLRLSTLWQQHVNPIFHTIKENVLPQNPLHITYNTFRILIRENLSTFPHNFCICMHNNNKNNKKNEIK